MKWRVIYLLLVGTMARLRFSQSKFSTIRPVLICNALVP
uniref:Uncharacterized protein n=1 Tax=mine drainage metagenome TaxID=410659 RepID=E6QRL9_9ZZZZ